ncbi:MAG: dethiobiotin synthase [Dehalococcoidia bacterium]|nr:dethiobiotin synthase [Dehalococcoidia bacterium]
MAGGIFITGTDTGVGKTLLTGGLAAVLRDEGIDAGVMKPVETGCHMEGGRCLAEDAVFLGNMAQSRDEMDLVNPYALQEPITPALAAERAGVVIDLSLIKKAFETLKQRHDIVLVEGAGGLLSPLYGEYLMAELARELEIPILLVSRGSLGTINHTLLSLYYASRESIPVTGVVVNHTSPSPGPSGALNPGAIRRWGKAPVLGVIPFLRQVNPETIKEAVKNNLDLAGIRSMAGEKRQVKPVLP